MLFQGNGHLQTIIHCADKDFDSLVSPKDLDKIRKHALILDIAKELPEEKIPLTVQYHRKYRSIFTMKRILETRRKYFSPNFKTEFYFSYGRPSLEEASTTRLYDARCIFCQKKSKYLKGKKNKRSPLTMPRAASRSSCREVATKKFDQRMLAITSRELVAAKGHYHISCYRFKDTIPTRSGVSASMEQATEVNYYQKIEIPAFKKL